MFALTNIALLLLRSFQTILLQSIIQSCLLLLLPHPFVVTGAHFILLTSALSQSFLRAIHFSFDFWCLCRSLLLVNLAALCCDCPLLSVDELLILVKNSLCGCITVLVKVEARVFILQS